MALMTCF
jgi:hypothetical protein